MSRYHSHVRLLYRLAWLSFGVAVLFRAAMIFPFGYQLYAATGALPRNFFELSIMLFVAAIATEAYARASAGT